jgi:hypothetical protein
MFGFLFGLLEMIEFVEDGISTLSTRLYEMIVSSGRNELSAKSRQPRIGFLETK